MKKRVKTKIKNAFLLVTTWLACVVSITTYSLMEFMDLNIKLYPEILVAFVVSTMWVILWVCINWKWIEGKCE